MENETQTPNQTPVQEVQQIQPVQPAQPKTRHITRNILIILGITVLGAVGYMAYKNPALFSASITGGSSQTNVTTDLYIPTDYKTSAGESGFVELLAGHALAGVTKIDLGLSFDKNKISLLTVERGSSLTASSTLTGVSTGDGKFKITLNLSPATDISVNDKLVKINVSLASGLSAGDQISLLEDILLINATPVITNPTYTPGTITVGTAVSLCANVTCGDHAACDQTSGQCVCFKGFDQQYLCNACSVGYTGFPDCKVDVLSNMLGVVLTLNNDTLASFSPAEHTKAYSSVYIMVNSSAAAGKTITLEGNTVNIPVSTAPSGALEVNKIKSITDNLKNLISGSPIVGVNVTKVTTSTGAEIPGLLKLTAVSGNADSSLEGITTNSGDVIIVPALESTITLLPTSSYQTRVIGKNTDGTVLELNFNNVIWQPQPVNRLSDTALKGGLLEKGDKGGVTPLYAQVEKADGTTIDSNKITVEVPAGPVVEYIHIIGSNPITKGGRVNLSVKVSDIDTISDIKDIRTSIVRSAQTTYAGISNDTSAVWFTATPVVAEVATASSGTQGSATTTTSTNTSTSTTSTSTTSTTPSIPTASENYRIYSIPVEIPQDVNMIDGSYNLLLQITDVAGHMATSVLPNLKIGAVATGDVDGNGTVNMLDVIAAFQIANGSNANPTQAQLQAADIDNNGKITMLDVITLFKKLNS